MRGETTKKRDYSFAKIPAIFMWITNVIHSLFTLWAISVGGSRLEMMALLPITFVEIPSMLVLLASVVSMIIARKERSAFLENLIPTVVYLIQVGVFWFFLLNK